MSPKQAVNNLHCLDDQKSTSDKTMPCAKTREQTVQNNETKYLESNIAASYLRFIIEKCSIL
jgi:hypothetical protein